MPNRTIYIRKEDVAAWDALPDRPEWLHKALSVRTVLEPGTTMVDGVRVTVPRMETNIMERQAERSAGFCKNGHPIPNGRDRCLGRGCKYS